MIKRIRECPFCGDLDISLVTVLDTGAMRCNNCQACGPPGPAKCAKDEANIRELWNDREPEYDDDLMSMWHRP